MLTIVEEMDRNPTAAFAAFFALYMAFQYASNVWICGRKMHRGLSLGCVYVSILHQAFLLPALTIYSVNFSRSSLAEWCAISSEKLQVVESYPLYAMIAYVFSDLTDFRAPAFNNGLVLHHMLTAFASYSILYMLPANANLALLMVAGLEFGSLGLNISLLLPNETTRQSRYYLYGITRLFAFCIWVYLMYSMAGGATLRTTGFVASGLLFWAHNFQLLLHLRKTAKGKCDGPVFELKKKET